MRNMSYSDIIETIGLIPIVAPDELIKSGVCNEHKRFDFKSKLVIVSKYIDFDTYLNASLIDRKRLIVRNILESIKSIKTRGKFNFECFEKDLLDFTGFSKDDIDLMRYSKP